MTLNHFTQPKKKQVSSKAALRRMHSIWYEGTVSRFDEKLASILGCSLERAEQIRESWVNMGFLCFDKRGLLLWRTGGF